MTKDVMDAIKQRRSIHSFTSERFPEETMSRVLEAGLWAPSEGNLQPWQFYVVYNDEKKKQLISERELSTAPVMVAVCADVVESKATYGEKGETLYCLQGAAAAVQNMLLAATAFGLGSLWVGDFNENEVRRVLEIPSHLRPVALLLFGYTDIEASVPARKSLEETVVILH